MREPLVVLGGGLAGLSAAYHLSGDVPVYEQQTGLGGLCSQATAGGFRFDAVPHVLHFRQDSTRAFVHQLLNGRLTSFTRQARVHSHGVSTRYPFQAHLFGLPPAVIDECLQGRLAAARRGLYDTTNFERWILSTFGEGIAKHFMVPYNTKFWTLPPSELTCEWVGGLVPVPSYEDMVRGAFEDDPTEYGYNVVFWYPSAGGLGAIVEGLLTRLPRVYLGKRLVRLETAARRLHFADGEVVEYEQLLSSIPLPELKALLDPLPAAVASALDALRWTSICVVHLGIQGAPAVPWDWVYEPDAEVSFYRVGFPGRYALDAAPDGCHILSAEISYSPWKPRDRAPLVPRVIHDLTRMELLHRAHDIVVQLPLELRYGYPIYDRHYAWATSFLHTYLRQRGVIPIGRFGSWRYLSMEETLLDGQRAAELVSEAVGHDPVPR